MPPLIERIPDVSILEKAKEDGYSHFPITAELLEDIFTPVGLYLRLRQMGSNSFLLESAEGGENIGRYSFMGVNPFATFTVANGEVRLTVGGETKVSTSSPIEVLRAFFSTFKVYPLDNLPRLSSGAVGYFGYNFVRYLERIPIQVEADSPPEVLLNFFDTIVAVDNLKRRVILIALVSLGGDIEGIRVSLEKCTSRLHQLSEVFRRPDKGSRDSAALDAMKCEIGIPSFNITKERYKENVERAKDYIIEGDIFQVVPSQRAEFKLKGDPFPLYRGLRTLNPSPYMFYLESHLPVGSAGKGKRLAVIGSSPEMFVRKEGRRVETRPIAGTSPRGATQEEDNRFTYGLLHDEKERAEHVMLVDLGRNDIGRVAAPGTVRVENFMHIEKFSHVMHIVSDVIGEANGTDDALQTLVACFPAGTLSGAPKIRAMEIISELEDIPRQVYGGAVGYIDFNDNMDTCIAIRTFVVNGDTCYLQAGGGIVYDSDPDREYNESLNKMKANLEALKLLDKFQ